MKHITSVFIVILLLINGRICFSNNVENLVLENNSGAESRIQMIKDRMRSDKEYMDKLKMLDVEILMQQKELEKQKILKEIESVKKSGSIEDGVVHGSIVDKDNNFNNQDFNDSALVYLAYSDDGYKEAIVSTGGKLYEAVEGNYITENIKISSVNKDSVIVENVSGNKRSLGFKVFGE